MGVEQEGTDRAVLGRIMERLASGDAGALFDLVVSFEPELARTVRTIAAKRGARLGADAVQELVTDAAMEIAAVAGAWKADGAPPWFWARGRIGAAVDRHIGLWTSPLDHETHEEREAPAPQAGHEPATVSVLEDLAERDGVVALLHEGLGRVASERDLAVFVEHSVQVALGDPSPSVTVGDLYGMKPAAVRQQHRRVRVRLRELALSDPRFAPLADLPLVA